MPRIEVKYNGSAGAALGSWAPGLMADDRVDLDWLIDLDSETGAVNCIVRRDDVQSHEAGTTAWPAADEPLTTKQRIPAIAITAAIREVGE